MENSAAILGSQAYELDFLPNSSDVTVKPLPRNTNENFKPLPQKPYNTLKPLPPIPFNGSMSSQGYQHNTINSPPPPKQHNTSKPLPPIPYDPSMSSLKTRRDGPEHPLQEKHKNPPNGYSYRDKSSLPYRHLAGSFASGAPAGSRLPRNGQSTDKSKFSSFKKLSPLPKPSAATDKGGFRSFPPPIPEQRQSVEPLRDLQTTILEGSRLWFEFYEYGIIKNIEYELKKEQRRLAAIKYAQMVTRYGAHPGIFRQELLKIIFSWEIGEEDRKNLDAVYTYLAFLEDHGWNETWKFSENDRYKQVKDMDEEEKEAWLEWSTYRWDEGFDVLGKEIDQYWTRANELEEQSEAALSTSKCSTRAASEEDLETPEFLTIPAPEDGYDLYEDN